MKLLLLLRHAQADRATPDLPDHDRPLDARGRQDAAAVGRLLLCEGLVPDRILSSTALRACATAERAAEGCGYKGQVRTSSRLYLADCLELLRPLRELDSACAAALVVAHQPGVGELLQLLTGESRPVPTAALARVHLPIESWKQLQQGVRGQLIDFWRQ
jgi:phosphohistidine phosphatase